MDEIEIIEYDSVWPFLFLEEERAVRKVLDANEIIAIEHVGSTAIPNMSAKPIIDISLVVKSLKKAQEFLVLLEQLGYVFWPENPNTNELFFVKGMPPYGERRTHHIRITEWNEDVKKKIVFRDWLIANPADALRYEVLKKALAEKYRHDRELYTMAKRDFIEEILKLAL